MTELVIDTAPVVTPLPAAPGLRRVLGAAFGVAITVGGAIGGGILRTPGDVAAAVPNVVLFMAAWVFGAAFTLLGATIFSELATMVPRAGGPYVYARRAFGDAIGSFVGYADWLNWCVGGVALAMIVGEYSGGLFPAVAGHPTLVALVALVALAMLQWIGVRSGGRTQEVTSLLKTLAFLALVVAAFTVPHAAQPAPAVHVPHGVAALIAFGVAMQGVIFTYASFDAVVYCSEEVRDYAREIPRALFRGVWLVIAIYLLVNAAYVTVVPIGRIAGDPFVGATVARVLFGQRGDTVVRVITIVSVLGTINAVLIALSRILLALGRDGLLPRVAARVNGGGTPYVALAASAAVIAVFLLTGSFTAVLAASALLTVVKYVGSFSALFALRRREPDAPRPYRAWGYPVAPAVALAVAAALLVAIVVSAPGSALLVFGLLVVSWPASRLAQRLTRGEGERA